MGRAPCCAKVGLNRGRWTAEEDDLLIKYIEAHGEGCWRALPQKAGLLRCGKSCRLRWINYLRADVKRGNISAEEEELIIKLHSLLGNRWSFIAGRMPGRTDNEIKNYWNTHLSRKLAGRGVDPLTHEPIAEPTSRSASKPSTIFTSNNGKQRQMKSQKQGIISQTQEEETAKTRASEKLRVKKKPKHKTMKRNFNLAARNESRSVSQQKTPGDLQVLVQPLHSPPISVNSSLVNRPSCESSCSELDSSPLVTMTSFSDEIQFFLRNSSEDRTATTLEASGEEMFKETHTEDVKIEHDEQYPCTDTALPVSSKFTDSPWDYSSSSHPLLLDMNLFGSDELFECLLPSNAERSRQLSAATETTTPQEDPDYLWPCFLSNVEAPYPTSLSSNIRRS